MKEPSVFKMKYDMLTRNGKEQFVVVPLKDYMALLEQVEDEADFRAIEDSKKRNAGKPLIPQEQVMREFGLTPKRKTRKS